MNVYRRYFIIKKGPVVKRAKEIIITNKVANIEYKTILDPLGADTTQWYTRDQRLTGIIFADAPDSSLFKKVRYGGWWPKKNTKKAKAIWQKLNDVKTTSESKLLELIGKDNLPSMLGGGKCYYTTCLILPYKSPQIIVNIPWYDEDPEIIKADPKHELNWEPTKEMIAIKEWQYKKAVCDFNDSLPNENVGKNK